MAPHYRLEQNCYEFVMSIFYSKFTNKEKNVLYGESTMKLEQNVTLVGVIVSNKDKCILSIKCNFIATHFEVPKGFSLVVVSQSG